MPVTVNHRKPAGYVVFRTNTTDGLKLNTANGKQGANSVDETVLSMAISELMWSTNGSATWTGARGANTVAVLGGSGYHDYQASGMRLEAYDLERQANVQFTLSGVGGGVVVAKLHKVSGE